MSNVRPHVKSFLVTYRPLAVSNIGRNAAREHGLPPFVDGSCRREPDLQSSFPSISALCRTHVFAPRLSTGDEVVYITVLSNFGESGIEPHYRLVAHLAVTDVSDNHEEAASWYRARCIPVPSNCMITGSKPVPYEHTNGRNDKGYRGQPAEAKLRWWDGEYRSRSRKTGTLVHCKRLHLSLYNPGRIYRQDMKDIFGRVPGTRNPPALPIEQVRALVALAKQREA